MRFGLHKKTLCPYLETREYKAVNIIMIFSMVGVASLRGCGIIAMLLWSLLFTLIVNSFISYVRDWEIHRQEWYRRQQLVELAGLCLQDTLTVHRANEAAKTKHKKDVDSKL